MWEGRSGRVGRGGRAAGREHCMRSPASNGVTCRLCRNTAAPPLLKKTNFAPRPPSKVKLSFFAGCSRSVLWMLSSFVQPKLSHPGHKQLATGRHEGGAGCCKRGSSILGEGKYHFLRRVSPSTVKSRFLHNRPAEWQLNCVPACNKHQCPANIFNPR